jgi:hypothetical protein
MMQEVEKRNQIVKSFIDSNSDVTSVGIKRKAESEVNSDYLNQRKKIIDDTAKEVKVEELKKVSPWIPQFTPEAKAVIMTEPPKRPLSPFSSQPIRSKDLISVNLIPESRDAVDASGPVKFICPVTR